MISTAEQGQPLALPARARVSSTTSAVTWCATPNSASSTGAIQSGSTPALQKGGSPLMPKLLTFEQLWTTHQLCGSHAACQPAAYPLGKHVCYPPAHAVAAKGWALADRQHLACLPVACCTHIHLPAQWPQRLVLCRARGKQQPAALQAGAGPPTCQRHGLIGRLVAVSSQRQPAARSAGGHHCSVDADSGAIDQEPSPVRPKGCGCQLLGLQNGALRV